VQLADFQEVLYGEMDGSTSARIDALHAFMSDAGFSARISRNIAQDLWNKWIMLAGMGAATCLMRGTIGEIEAAPGGHAFVNALIDEIVAIAAANGHAPAPPVVAAARGMLTAKGSTMASSMYRDLQQMKPIEADAIIGDLIARAEAKGVKAPLLAAHMRTCASIRTGCQRRPEDFPIVSSLWPRKRGKPAYRRRIGGCDVFSGVYRQYPQAHGQNSG